MNYASEKTQVQDRLAFALHRNAVSQQESAEPST